MILDLTDPIGLQEVLGDRDGVSLGRLIKVTRRRDVLIGELLDEDLLLCGSYVPEDEPDPHWAPYMARLNAHDRGIALRTAARHLKAFGILAPNEEEGDDIELFPPLSIVAHALRSAVAAVTWRMQIRGEGDNSGGALLLPGGLALHDEIDTGTGEHGLVFRSAQREADHLAAWMDSRSSTRSTGPPVVASSIEELRPSPRELATRAGTSTVVVRTPRTPQGGRQQAVTAYGTDEGLWLLRGPSEADPVAMLQLVSDADLLALTRQLVTLGR